MCTGFFDQPMGRKDHAVPTPYLGGAAVVAVLLFWPSLGWLWARFSAVDLPGVASALRGELATRGALWLAFAGGILIALLGGTWDDRAKLRPRTKLAWQGAAALVPVLAGGLRFDWLGSEALGACGAVLWIVGVMNAFNFLDNMNGVLAGVVASLSMPFFVLAYAMDQTAVAALLAVTIGACLGFLPFNFPRARIFLGDGGSQALGFWIGALTVQASYLGPGTRCALAPWLVPPALIAVPALDLVHVVWSRRRLGVPISRGDHRHFSHRLAERWGSKTRAAYGCWGAAALLGTMAILLPWCSTWQAILVIAAQAFCFLWIGGPLAGRRRIH